MKKPVIEGENLWHIYPGSPPVIALKGINLKVYEGEMLAIIGQNGSGKTTLVKHFNGLLKPTKGTVRVFGMDVSKEDPATLCQKVGYIFQNPDHMLFSKTIEEEVSFGPKSVGLPDAEVKKRVEEALKIVGIYDIRNEYPRTLPLIYRAKTAIASILALNPEVIVFDEPTTGQDFAGSRQLLEYAKLLNERGKTIIFITHDMNLVANYATRAVVLHEGQILLEGTPEEIFSKEDVLSSSYLEPPPLIQFANRLKGLYNFNTKTVKIDVLSRELVDFLINHLSKKC